MSDPLLLGHGLSKVFTRGGGLFGAASEMRALDDIDIALASGERLGVVGESGSGKSTLGRVLLGLTKPSSGKVVFDGKDHASRDRSAWKSFRRETALVQQNPLSALNPQIRIGSQVAEPLIVHGIQTSKQAMATAEQLLARVGINNAHMARYPHQLSGGQRQRVVLARALIASPKLVVFDEAVSALDVSVQAQVIAIINELQQQFRLTSIFISHDLRVIRHVSDRIAVMYLGRLVELSPVESIYRTQRHPYTRSLLAAVPKLDPHDRGRLSIVSGDVGDAASSGCAFRPRCPFAIARCATGKPALRQVGSSFSACHRAAELPELRLPTEIAA